MMSDVICIGDATIDISLRIAWDNPHIHLSENTKSLTLPFGGKTSIEDGGIYVGGNASNVAVGLSKAGLSTTLISDIGKDANGDFILQELKEHGVDTRFIKQSQSVITRYSVIIEYKGERTILAPHPKREYRLPKLFDHSWLFVSSMGIGSDALLKKLPAQKKRFDSKIAANPGTFQLRGGKKAFTAFLKSVDLLFVNKEEAAILTEENKKKEPDLLTALTKFGPKHIVLTDGKRGAWTLFGGRITHAKAFPAKVVAKTGAGDATASGTLAALLYGVPPHTATLYGMANASGVVTEYGAHNGLLSIQNMRKIVKYT